MSPSLDSITPLIPSGPDFDGELRFYVEEMGFTVAWRDGGMAGNLRDGISFHLVQNSDRAWAENSSFSIGVRGLDELYRQFRGLSARVGPLETKAWGRREFHMIVASGVCFQFYERPATP
jgi:hypothetical protein